MLRYLFLIALSVGICSYALTSCQHEPYDTTKGNFPAEISSILVRKCATEGCHDAAGAVNAAGLRLDNWDELFKGSSHGAVVVPYSTKYSTLLYYINQASYGNNDIIAVPSMPYNMAALTAEEYNTIKNWIANGAPDANGNIAFASDANARQKVYIAQQGCVDHLAVIDAKSGLVMRYIPIGVTNTDELAHNIRTSSDGRYAYVCFFQGTVVHKIDTRTDEVVGTANIGDGNWQVLLLSPDDSKLLVTGTSTGQLAFINTADMTLETDFSGLFIQPHGLAASPGFDTLYITSQFGNTIYRYILSQFDLSTIILDNGAETHTTVPGVTPDPHEIMMSPDNSKLFVTCQNNKQVKIVDLNTEQVLLTHNVGDVPKEIAYSKKRNLMFVTCMEDANNNYSAKSRGSVYVFDATSGQQVGSPIYGDFYQPHGIVVDERNDLIYIASRNANIDGPAPHHSSGCNGRNGWYSIYDLNTLQPKNKIRYEVTPDPYGLGIRFK
jgi:DNA-binding beta-propeller fold protein YncE